MRLSTVVATGVAGVLLASLIAGTADGGWFGIGGSDKASEAKTPQTGFYNPNLVASGATASPSGKKSSSGGFGSLFGMNKSSTTAQRPANKSAPSTSRSKTSGKSDESSWWNSWFKPKEAPPKKTTVNDWMKLKPVRW